MRMRVRNYSEIFTKIHISMIKLKRLLMLKRENKKVLNLMVKSFRRKRDKI